MGVAPQFVRKVEHIGEEVWDMRKRLPVTMNNGCPVLSLGDGVVPVFHAPTLVEDNVGVICNIASCKYAGLFCFQVFIYGDAVFDVEAAIPKELQNRSCANSDYGHVAGNPASARQDRGCYPVFAFKADDVFLFEQLNTARNIVALEKFGHWRREDTTPDAVFSNDQSRFNILLSENTPPLHSDESAAEDNRPLAAFRTRSDLTGVVHGTQIKNVWQLI